MTLFYFFSCNFFPFYLIPIGYLFPASINVTKPITHVPFSIASKCTFVGSKQPSALCSHTSQQWPLTTTAYTCTNKRYTHRKRTHVPTTMLFQKHPHAPTMAKHTFNIVTSQQRPNAPKMATHANNGQTCLQSPYKPTTATRAKNGHSGQ